jgi:indole-3-glycerol phosphate synthase
MNDDNQAIDNQIKRIVGNRDQLLQSFCEAFLAENLPDGATHSWLVNNIELVEVQKENETRLFFKRRNEILVNKRKVEAIEKLISALNKIATLTPASPIAVIALDAIDQFRDVWPEKK